MFIYRNGTNKSDSNPFDEEEWDEGDSANILVDNGEPGIPVKALYDYDGAESDELTFKQGKFDSHVWFLCFESNSECFFITGEVFEKLEDEDEQGWCKGRKNGRVGLYPANYVEAVAT